LLVALALSLVVFNEDSLKSLLTLAETCWLSALIVHLVALILVGEVGFIAVPPLGAAQEVRRTSFAHVAS